MIEMKVEITALKAEITMINDNFLEIKETLRDLKKGDKATEGV